MSVYISEFTGSTAWAVVHDEPGHGGTIDPGTIQHTLNADGSENHSFLVVTCPVCQASSTHPVGGGAQPQLVQQLFVTLAELNGCPCGAVQAGDTSAAPTSHVRLNCNRMDGPGRWQLA